MPEMINILFPYNSEAGPISCLQHKNSMLCKPPNLTMQYYKGYVEISHELKC